jgi:tRNA threonylcarbamoyladenosine modification (KEOPS) complex  Pcc1 subunit
VLFLLSAKLVIDMGDDAKDYIRIVGKGESYKRGSVLFSSKEGRIEITAKAEDPTALIASLGSALKQLGIVSGVKSMMK